MTIRIIALPLLAFVLFTDARTGTPQICASPEFREFDFWVGSWRVSDADGKTAGDNVISLEQGGCVLVERWRSAGGGTGMSLNYYDPAAQLWKQR